MKWLALALTMIGMALSLGTRSSPGEEGQPAYVLLGWFLLTAGLGGFAALLWNVL